MAKKKCSTYPLYSYDWFRCSGGEAFAPLYGPWAAMGTEYPSTPNDPSDTPSPSPVGPARPGPGGINSPDVPAGPNAGMGPVEHRMKTMKGLIEGLGFMNTVLGGQSDIIDVDLTGFDVEDDPIAVPTVAKALTAVVHKSFSKAADDMMIAGHLSQEQRIALSHCISAALQAFTAEAEENCTWALDQIIDDEMAARFMESK